MPLKDRAITWGPRNRQDERLYHNRNLAANPPKSWAGTFSSTVDFKRENDK